jgi:hypothetical protein
MQVPREELRRRIQRAEIKILRAVTIFSLRGKIMNKNIRAQYKKIK